MVSAAVLGFYSNSYILADLSTFLLKKKPKFRIHNFQDWQIKPNQIKPILQQKVCCVSFGILDILKKQNQLKQ